MAPQQQQHPLPPGPGPPQPVRTLPSLLTALASSLDRLWPHNAMTLHMDCSGSHQARILESIDCEVETCTQDDWVQLLATRFFLKAEQLRQRTPPAVRSPHSLAAVPVDVMRSGALRVAAGFALVFTLAPDITQLAMRDEPELVVNERMSHVGSRLTEKQDTPAI